jgi:CRP-like cAMP-binding protein
MLEQNTFAPDDIVFEMGSTSRDLYFVREGRLELCHLRTETTFKTLSDNKYFGELGFFLDWPRTCDAI